MKNIIDFKPLSGKHCVSGSIRQIFKYFGHQMSEEMIFGLSSALNFFYLDFKNFLFPQIGGRNKLGDFEDNLADHLNIKIDINETTSTRKAYNSLIEQIENDVPVMIYVDMAFLPYLGLPDDAHFGGHSIVVFGIDEEEGYAYISDRDAEGFRISGNNEVEPADFHKLSLENLKKARGSTYKPYPPKNKWLKFDFSGMKPVNEDVVIESIKENVETMLNPPIKNLGVKGIKLFSERIMDWKDFEGEKLKWAAHNSYIMINQIGGTGGGAFRKMYGDFLKESSSLITPEGLEQVGVGYNEVSKKWDRVADMFYKIFETGEEKIITDISEHLKDIHKDEIRLMKKLKTII